MAVVAIDAIIVGSLHSRRLSSSIEKWRQSGGCSIYENSESFAFTNYSHEARVTSSPSAFIISCILHT